jgi:uncharacterized membrane protein YqaE (UPF0057 family)
MPAGQTRAQHLPPLAPGGPVRYLIAILLPPVAMLTVGKPFQALLCLILMLTVIAWPIAAIWAIFVVHSSFADARNKKLIDEMRKSER